MMVVTVVIVKSCTGRFLLNVRHEIKALPVKNLHRPAQCTLYWELLSCVC